MARCASCGADNPARDRFCGDCGSSLSTRCPQCGEAVSHGRRFCGQCGAALAPGPPVSAPPGPPGPVTERRVCSVLFADLVDFTGLAASRDPEEVREILSRYFEVCRRLIGRYGGIVEKFIGDAVMAVWGTPVTTEEDAERAVRAALDLVAAVPALGTELGEDELTARAGVVTGQVAATIGATGEGMVAGDAVNTASRVQAVAPPGCVLVDEGTKRLVEAAIECEYAGEHELKGRAAERLFWARRVLSGVGGRQRARVLEAPFTGRGSELRAVKDLFHTTVDRRTSRLAVVAGPAGVGKSRLGWEFEKYTDGLASTVLWHRGRCLSYGEGVAFWALAEIVRQRLGIGEEDPIDVASHKLGEGMARFVSDEEEREYVAVRLSRLLGVPYGADRGPEVVMSRDELFAGWRLFFERLAAIAPVVMLVEDAHHADDGLLAFFDHLIEWARNVPVFVLLFARPGMASIDSGFAVGRSRATLSLDPLDDASMESIVESLVPGMPDQARRAIAARSEGVPLFAVETVRSLVDRGLVDRDAGGVCRLSGDISTTVQVPGSLHGLLAARLDAVPQPARKLVAVASVLGTSFQKENLAAVSKESPDLVTTALDELVKRGVLEIFADPLSPERGAYRFGQEMLRQVAYEALARRDRKSLHLAVASHLRSVYPGDGEAITDIIARHYLDAMAADPGGPDAGELRAQAVELLVRAAEHARRAGAPARAAETFEEAAELEPASGAGLLFERAAESASESGAFERAVSLAGRARAAHAEHGDGRGVARAQVIEGGALQYAGRTSPARDVLLAALTVLRSDPDADTVEAMRRLALVELFAGHLAEGERLADDAIALAQETGAGTAALARLFTAKGIAAALASRQPEASAFLQMSAEVAERAGDLSALTVAQHNLADVLSRTDPRRAVETARSSIEHARRTGQRAEIGLGTANLSIALLELGDWDEAEKSLRVALEVDRVEDEDVHRLVGWLAALRGDAAGAEAALEHLSSSRTSEEPQAKASIAVLEALVADCNRTPRGALVLGLAALEHRGAVGIGHESQRWAWPLCARAARSLGDAEALRRLIGMLDDVPVGRLPGVLRAAQRLTGALLDADDADDAADDAGADADLALEGAIEALRELGHPYELGHALVDHAAVLRRRGRDGASLAITEALQIAARLRSAPLEARVRTVAGETAAAGAHAVTA